MEKVKDWSEVNENLFQFIYVLKGKNSIAYTRFSQYFHWYYFPIEDTFAPSKFIGYKNSTAENYFGRGSGGETQHALKKFFHKVEEGTSMFENLKEKIEDFEREVGKKLSAKVFNGSGGLYYPKSKFAEVKSSVSQKIFDSSSRDIETYLDEESTLFEEGKQKKRWSNYYERNPQLRAKAIAIHGYNCQACGFNFERAYGERGRLYIEVHHIVPISEIKEEFLVDPSKDLGVVCSNCHRMIHRKKDKVLSISEIKSILKKKST